MAAYQYNSKEERDKHNAWRREYYQANRQHIRERDNITARKSAARRKERMKKLGIKRPPYIRKKVNPEENPDRAAIEAAIREEELKSGD